ncbi:MAG: hypothetical protein ACTSRG_01160 [Candidatus Helarchaeota archaeon]
MIHSYYIINQAGIAIYTEHFVKSNVDEQLLSGFLTAIGGFSQEAIGGELQKLNIKTGEQMVLYYHEPSKLTIVAIANEADHSGLLQNLLKKIVNEFYKTYRKYLKEEGLFEDTNLFSKSSRRILSGKSAKRGVRQLILGLFLGLVVLIFLVALTLGWFLGISGAFAKSIDDVITINNLITQQIITILGLSNTDFFAWLQASFLADLVIDKSVEMQAHFFNMSFGTQLLLILSFSPSAFLGGYIAGNRKYGRWIGFLFLGLAIGIMTLFIHGEALHQLLFYIAVYSPLILISCFVFGYVGGLIRERMYLNPLPTERKLESYKGEEIPQRGLLTTLSYIFAVFGVISIFIGLMVIPFLIIGSVLVVLAIHFEIKERKKF